MYVAPNHETDGDDAGVLMPLPLRAVGEEGAARSLVDLSMVLLLAADVLAARSTFNA